MTMKQQQMMLSFIELEAYSPRSVRKAAGERRHRNAALHRKMRRERKIAETTLSPLPDEFLNQPCNTLTPLKIGGEK